MKGKAKQIEAVKAWGAMFPTGLSLWAVHTSAEAHEIAAIDTSARIVPVRIIRESDYRRLLQAAKGQGKP